MKKENFDDLIYQAFARDEKQKTGKVHEQDHSQDCLSDETICLYLESLLSDAERDRVQEHLCECSFCLESVIDVVKAEALEKTEISQEREETESRIKAKAGFGEVTEAIIKPLQISLAWIGGHLILKETDAEFIPFWNDLKPILVRGGSDKKTLSLPPFSKTCGDFKVMVCIIKEEEGKCAIQFRVFPLSEKKEGVRIKVELVKEGRMLRSFLLENDTLLFQGISPGEYLIHIRDGEHLLGDISIKIK